MFGAGFYSESINPESPHFTSASILNLFSGFQYYSTFFLMVTWCSTIQSHQNVRNYWTDPLYFCNAVPVDTELPDRHISSPYLWETPRVLLSNTSWALFCVFPLILTSVPLHMLYPRSFRMFPFLCIPQIHFLIGPAVGERVPQKIHERPVKCQQQLIYCDYPPSPDKEMSAQPGWVTCPRSQSM